MRLDAQLVYQNLGEVEAEAARLQGLGFDCLWTFETQHDPFLPLALAARAAPGARIGTNIAVAFARTPMATAMTAWDLAVQSGGGFMLGLGTQVRMHIERRFGAEWGRPAARVAEYIRCIRAIWDCWQNGTKPDFQGEFYQFRLMSPFFNPGPIEHPAIPIYLAGVNPTMCRTAGQVADGFHVHPLNSARYLKEVVRPTIAEGAQGAGRKPEDVQLHASVFVIAAEDPAERAGQEAFVRGQIAFYASTPNYRAVMDLHGWVDTAEALSKKVRAGEWDTLGQLVSDEMLDAFAVAGTPATLPGLLRDRYAGLLERMSLYMPPPKGPQEAAWGTMARDFNGG